MKKIVKRFYELWDGSIYPTQEDAKDFARNKIINMMNFLIKNNRIKVANYNPYPNGIFTSGTVIHVNEHNDIVETIDYLDCILKYAYDINDLFKTDDNPFKLPECIGKTYIITYDETGMLIIDCEPLENKIQKYKNIILSVTDTPKEGSESIEEK